MRERRHAVLQLAQLFDIGQRQQIGARRNRLADLDEGGAEFQQLPADPLGLPSQMPLFRFILFADEPPAVVNENKKLINRERKDDLKSAQPAANSVAFDQLMRVEMRDIGRRRGLDQPRAVAVRRRPVWGLAVGLNLLRDY
jgi:hypothetical protein